MLKTTQPKIGNANHLIEEIARPDYLREIENIRYNYGENWVSALEALGNKDEAIEFQERLQTHRFALSSYNWLTNYCIDEVYTQELNAYAEEYNVGAWDWYAILCRLLEEWVLSRNPNKLICRNRTYRVMNLVDFWKNFYCKKADFVPWKSNDLIADVSNMNRDLLQYFPNTISLINNAAQHEDLYFLDDKDSRMIPTSVIVDPLFLVITFIH